MRLSLRTCLIFAVGAIVAGGTAWLYGAFIASLSNHFDLWRIVTFDLLLRMIVPLSGGLLAVAYDRRGRRPVPADAEVSGWTRPRRSVAAVLLLAYGITWAVGAPTVTSQLAMEEIATSKTLERRHPGQSWQEFPVTRTRFALPLAPGLVVAFHESSLGPNYGWGGWVFFAWWGTGSTQLGTAWRWMT